MPGGFGGDTATLQAAVTYAKAHGGGTIGVASQSSAATVILSSDANVAGLGGFSGRESTVTAAWLATEVRDGHLRWVIVDQSQGARLPGDTRTGSQAAMDDVAKACRAVTLTTSPAAGLPCMTVRAARRHSGRVNKSGLSRGMKLTVYLRMTNRRSCDGR